MPATKKKKKGHVGKKKGKKETKIKTTMKSAAGTEVKEPLTRPPLRPGERLVNLLKYHPVDKREIFGTRVTTHVLEKLTPQEIHDLKTVFEIFDCDSDGYLSSVDLWRVLRTLGFKLSREEMAKTVQGTNFERRRKINFCEFLEVVIDRQGDARDTYGEIMHGFQLLDLDGTGAISLDKLQKVCSQTDSKFTHKELTEMLEEADLNGDGSVDQSEFIKIMMRTNIF